MSVRVVLDGGDTTSDTLALIIPDRALEFRTVSAGDSAVLLPWPDGPERVEGRLLRLREARSWNGLEVQMELEWREAASQEDPGQSRPAALSSPCLVVPDMLPRVVDPAHPLAISPPERLPHITFDEELPRGFSAGGVSMPDRSRKPTRELVQSVVFRRNDANPEYDDLAVTSSAGVTSTALQQAYRYAAPLVQFVKDELHLGMPVRPVLYIVQMMPDDMYPPAGAYCPVAAIDVGAERPNAGKPVNAVRLLTQAWLAAGTRIWGENAVSLRLAIGGALGLRWIQAAGQEQYLQRILKSAEGTEGHRPNESQLAIDDIVRSMQVPLFRAFQHPRLRHRLGELIEAHWGLFLPQDELIEFFRRNDVQVPHVFA